MTAQIQRVKRTLPCPPALPRDCWKERIFLEADGTENIIVYSGKWMPSFAWPQGMGMRTQRQPVKFVVTRRRPTI